MMFLTKIAVFSENENESCEKKENRNDEHQYNSFESQISNSINLIHSMQ